jgi:hypothetical protein
MNQHSLTTRLEEYIKVVLPEAHGHQQKAIRDFIAALLLKRSCCQATLARCFDNFEAASRRLSRLLHNPRLEPEALSVAHAQALVNQLPIGCGVRVAIDWTSEDQQHLLVASLLVGRRAVPIYWQAYATRNLKGAQKTLERRFTRHLCETVLRSLERRRLIVMADRGFCDVDFLDLLDELGVSFVIRTMANVKLYWEQAWRKLGSLRLSRNQRRRVLGKLWFNQSNPRRYWLAQSRARNRAGHWEYWHLVSNRPLSALQMAQEYAHRFGCEEGFRDAKRLLGFATARIQDLKAWARMFALVAAALLILTRLGRCLLEQPQRHAWLRKVRSRRGPRSELSLVCAVLALLDQVAELWDWFEHDSKLKLEAKL